MDLNLLRAQWSATVPPDYVRSADRPDALDRRQHKRCTNPVAIKRNGEPAKAWIAAPDHASGAACITSPRAAAVAAPTASGRMELVVRDEAGRRRRDRVGSRPPHAPGALVGAPPDAPNPIDVQRKAALSDPVAGVVLPNDARLADLHRPPAQVRQPVPHRPVRQALRSPLLDQRLDVPALEAPRPQAAVPEAVQRLRRLRQGVAARAARAVRSPPVAVLQAQQVEVQLAHADLRRVPLVWTCSWNSLRLIGANLFGVVSDPTLGAPKRRVNDRVPTETLRVFAFTPEPETLVYQNAKQTRGRYRRGALSKFKQGGKSARVAGWPASRGRAGRPGTEPETCSVVMGDPKP